MSVFSNLFSGVFSKKTAASSELIDMVADVLDSVCRKAQFNFDYDLQQDKNNISVELYGEDAYLLKKRGGQLLDAFQTFIKKVLQHNFPGKGIDVYFDSDGLREEFDQDLLDMADQLKKMALKNQKSVYCKPLSPSHRRMIHKHLAEDNRVKTKSIGYDYYKKIKIIPFNERRGYHRDRTSYGNYGRRDRR